ncbi:MAG: hypothetical protein GY810_32210 [Aureispira sp.]|nr:hypothetical protein [Aureispira sp.]
MSKNKKGLLFLKIGMTAVLTIACLFGIMFGILFMTLPNISNTLAFVMLILGALFIGPTIWFSIKFSREHEELIAREALSKPNNILLQWENNEEDKIIVTRDTLFRKRKYWKHTKFKGYEISLRALKIIDKGNKKALSFEFKHAWYITEQIDLPEEQEIAAKEVVNLLNKEYKL